MSKESKDEWMNPIIDMTKYQRIVALYYIENDEECLELKMDILSFDGICNVFRGNSGFPAIKYKDIKKWIPIPELPGEEKMSKESKDECIDEWINVRFEMPLYEESVICKGFLDNEESVFAGHWDDRRNLDSWYCYPIYWCSCSHNPETVVTHWMPYPKIEQTSKKESFGEKKPTNCS